MNQRNRVADLCVILVAVAVFAGNTQTLLGQDQNGPKIKVLSAVDIEEKADGEPTRATTVEVTLAPGGKSLPHRHPGAVFGYVIEGTFEFKVAGKPAQTLKTGETFYEPKMILHEVGKNPSDKTTTRVLAVIVHPRTSTQLVIPEPPSVPKAEDK